METEPLDSEQLELYEHHRFTVDRGQEPMRLDKYLQMRLEGISRNKVQAAAKAGCIKVNEKEAKSNYKVKPQDTISVLLPEPPHNFELLPEKVDFRVVYEDEDVIVIDKPAGLVVHPGVGNWNSTLVNGLLYYMGVGQAPKPSEESGREYPYLVHRIDKDTSGLLLVARHEEAQVALARQFFEHSVERKYVALVWGDFEEENGTIDANLARSVQDRRVMAVCDEEHGKHAVTHYRAIERFGYTTLIECVLETGRTHQIRAHMRHIGHPLFADAAYGGDQILKGTTFSRYRRFVENCFDICPRQALHAQVLGFEHPRTGTHLHFESPLPEDMERVVGRWREYTLNHDIE